MNLNSMAPHSSLPLKFLCSRMISLRSVTEFHRNHLRLVNCHIIIPISSILYYFEPPHSCILFGSVWQVGLASWTKAEWKHVCSKLLAPVVWAAWGSDSHFVCMPHPSNGAQAKLYHPWPPLMSRNAGVQEPFLFPPKCGIPFIGLKFLNRYTT